MKYSILFAIAWLFNQLCFSQISDIKNDSILLELNSLKVEIQNNLIEIKKLDRKIVSYQKITGSMLGAQNSRIDSLALVVNKDVANLQESSQQLGEKINATEESANSEIQQLEQSITRNTYFWVLCFVLAVFLSVGIFLLLKRNIQNSGEKLSREIEGTRKKLEEEGVKLDNKLLELLEKQLSVKQEQKQISPQETEPDHSLALKVADEIVRIQKNLSQMDDSVKGIKQLSASVERIRSNFEANGYEIVDMLNKPYNDGMKVQANFRPDDSLKEGEQIITRIIKPQVNYSGVMIQSAQIEVSQG